VPLAVRFAPSVSADERADLLKRLRQAGFSARMSPADLDHRALSGLSRKVLRAVVLDAADHLGANGWPHVGQVVRDWVRDTDNGEVGSGSAQLITAAKRSVLVDGRVPDGAFSELAESAETEDGPDRLGWNGTDWSATAFGDGKGPSTASAESGQQPEPLQVLAVADEWFSQRGGISTINRELCVALAAVDGVEVWCLIVGSFSEEERLNAAGAKVTLVESTTTPGLRKGQSLLRPPRLPDGDKPDVVIGHGQVTGAYALALAEDFYERACHFHFVHTEPDLLEWLKLGRNDDPASRAEERSWTDWELGGRASRAVGVGPILFDMLERDLPRSAPLPHRLDPGFDPSPMPPPESLRGNPLVTLMGRLEDGDTKGVALAVRATNRALRLRPDIKRVDLLLRGVREGDGKALSQELAQWVTEPRLKLLPRNYTTDRARLHHDLGRVWLALMPSLAEAFGLVGSEHVRAGIPCFMSADSGVGNLITEVAPDLARHVVLPVTGGAEDEELWAHRIAEVIAHPEGALARATHMRDVMARARSWDDAVRRLLDEARAALADRN
jgi:glycosyltransferase involved in cell wall biosynthesis